MEQELGAHEKILPIQPSTQPLVGIENPKRTLIVIINIVMVMVKISELWKKIYYELLHLKSYQTLLPG